MLGKSGKTMEREKGFETHVEDPLCHEFAPSEGIEESL
jgi:hypothetical protein